MKITLIRHGESIANVGNFISDDPRKPVGLTERGKGQAQALAERLRSETFTHAYASEFPRAQQTAAILLQHHACPLHIDARLNERKSGMDGLPVHLFNDQVKRDPLHFKTVQWRIVCRSRWNECAAFSMSWPSALPARGVFWRYRMKTPSLPRWP